MPKLEEGNFWIRGTLPMSISLEQSARRVTRMREILRSHPEVLAVVSQLGRPDDGTDLAGFQDVELFAPLKPYDRWPRGLTKEKLTEQLSRELEGEFPGVVFNFSQYLSDNVEEALSGVKGAITAAAPDGSQIPLGQLARITEESGPSVIYREDGSRYSPVKFSVRGRDLGSTIAEAQRRIADQVRLPPAAHLEWAGQINELREAMGRLAVIIPLTLGLIALLVYGAVKTWLDAAIVLISIPVACLGGIVALLLTREPFSVSAAMGFVSIFGIAIQDAILVVTYAQRQWADGKTLVDGARAAAEQRFRAGLMTTLTATLGLLPAALSNGIGAQAQKPLAIVVIGGSLALAGLTRVVQPPLLVIAHRIGERLRIVRPAAAHDEAA